MAALKLVWTKLAISDLDDVYEYVAATNTGAAMALIARIEKAITALRFTPNMGRPGRISGTRELVVTGTPFIVPYRVKEDRIEIIAVIHSARRWPGSFP